ncbi:uncharacterized protein LOC131672927 [Phymastichus coffea]|uniref:uncharacterized protein LOC131672927 n=1 Tax=Phymastichus coffea TaxID=108790 RepID=UPI00273C6717|nr:uncharacterized protein LOC131672927 [Phymastichus coffea]
MSNYKWKGRFVSKQGYQALCSRSKNARNRLKKLAAEREEAAKRKEAANLRSNLIKGNRIVDLDYMAEQLVCSKCSSELFISDIEKEQRSGLGSYLSVRCRMCLHVETIKSSRQYINPSSGQPVFSINTKAALGAIHTGMGQTHLSELFTVMELPSINSQTFKKHEQIIGPIIEFVAKERCSEAAMERAMTEESIEEMKKLLLNLEGSAKAMEADRAVELVTKSQILKEANVQVGVFIGDNDSSSISAIQNASNHKIVKQFDMNHSTKNVGGALHEIKKVNDPEKELSNDIIKYIQRCFAFAVHQDKGDILNIQKAIRNIPEHLFDHHENCGSWCRDDSENGIRLYNVDLYDALKNFFNELVDDEYKFVSAASSQANESLNHSMCSKAPKGNSYSTSESCDYRFSVTKAQKNIGKKYLVKSMDTLDMIVNKQKLEKHAEDYEKKVMRIRNKSSRPEFKKQRLENKIKKSQLRNRKERSDDYTYKSEMNLIDKKQPKCITVLDLNTPYKFDNPNLAVIFFDLETSSLKSNYDILQISMKCHKYILNVTGL